MTTTAPLTTAEIDEQSQNLREILSGKQAERRQLALRAASGDSKATATIIDVEFDLAQVESHLERLALARGEAEAREAEQAREAERRQREEEARRAEEQRIARRKKLGAVELAIVALCDEAAGIALVDRPAVVDRLAFQLASKGYAPYFAHPPANRGAEMPLVRD